MEAEGFKVYEAEWWHFDYKDWQRYRIGNERFEMISRKGAKIAKAQRRVKRLGRARSI